MSRYSAGSLQALAEVVAEPVGLGLQVGERLDVGLLLGGVATTRGERHLDVVSGVPWPPSRHRRSPASTTRSAKDTSTPALAWISSSLLITCDSSSGSLDLPAQLRL